MKKQTAIIFYSIILIGIIILNFSLWFYGKDFSCSKCVLEFNQHITSGFSHNVFIYSHNATDLYDSFMNESCLISWDRVGGYYYG